MTGNSEAPSAVEFAPTSEVCPTSPPPANKSYDTPDGHALARQILLQKLPYEPHDYLIEGICSVLDGYDLLATTATGGGKTGFFLMLMLVASAISENQQLALGQKHIPKDPAMVLICPTKALQEDMSLKMIGLGLKTLVINADTYSEGIKNGKDVWVEAYEKYTMILLSPEQLINRGFSQLLENQAFLKRVYAMGVDEVHLLYWWGKSLRPCFRHLGHIRARLPAQLDGSRIPLVAVTATLRVGEPMDCITRTLGLVPGQYRFIWRSNMRHDIQLIFRELRSGIGSYNFPELDWVLSEGDNTIIFCKTIALGFRVASYLWCKASNMPNRHQRLRLYNSLNWPSYNSETLGFLNNNEASSITIATDTLSVGWDSQYTRNAIIVGEPNDIDEYVQKIGRVGRNHRAVPFPRALLYYTRGAIATARKVVEGQAHTRKRSGITKEGEPLMDLSMAQLLLADCFGLVVDQSYDNPRNDLPCKCRTCDENPPPTRQDKCNCSGPHCQPE
ncbi:P-loop containing nucleoside triphosphate hydrolase protein, partial [Infundibulicybe gibba]